MTVIKKYVCDICGKVFSNETECLEHELLEKFDKIQGKTIFFNEEKEIIPIQTIVKGSFEVEAIFIKDKNVIPLVIETFDYRGIVDPWSSDGGCNERKEGLYQYDNNLFCWYLPADRIKKIKEEMEKYGVDA